MAWWKTKSKVEPTKEPLAEEVDEFEKAVTSYPPITTSTTITGGVFSYSHPHGYYFHGDDLSMLHELQKLANALGLKTAEDVRKVFGEIYERHYTGVRVMIK